jgi:hypothetical protein
MVPNGAHVTNLIGSASHINTPRQQVAAPPLEHSNNPGQPKLGNQDCAAGMAVNSHSKLIQGVVKDFD